MSALGGKLTLAMAHIHLEGTLMALRLVAGSVALSLCGCATMPSTQTASALVGTWRLQDRIDRTADGRELVEPSLGRDPLALLIYDVRGHVAAQLMKRDRSHLFTAAASGADPNNSAAQGGYDAYFGTYVVSGNTVTHFLEAALDKKDVGRRLTRNFRVHGNSLIIYFPAREPDGTPVTRTLSWQRAAP